MFAGLQAQQRDWLGKHGGTSAGKNLEEQEELASLKGWTMDKFCAHGHSGIYFPQALQPAGCTGTPECELAK